jgi:hypothetical protein
MDDDDPTTGDLRERQDEVSRREAAEARAAGAEPEARAHARRSEKAAYLRDKLADAEASEREG